MFFEGAMRRSGLLAILENVRKRRNASQNFRSELVTSKESDGKLPFVRTGLP